MRFEDLLLTGRLDRRLSAAQSRSFTKVLKGVYVHIDALQPDQPPWVIGQRVSEARILAVGTKFPSLRDEVRSFSRESAMICWDVGTTDPNPSLTLRGPLGSNKRLTLPAVNVGKTAIPPTTLRRCQMTRDHAEYARVTGQVFADGLRFAAVDIARTGETLRAVADVSAILRRESRFDRRRQDESRAREEEARSAVLRLNGAGLSAWNRAKAQKILSAADAGAESPGEAMLKWLVLEALQTGTDLDTKVVSQHPVWTPDGTRYLDLAIPDHGIAIEFDGYSKLVARDGHPFQLLRDEKHREAAIASEGWRFLRITSDDLRDPYICGVKVASQLSELGIDVNVLEVASSSALKAA